jgi:hypothetical protein
MMEIHKLEDLIAKLWCTCEDLDTVIWSMYDRETAPTEDELANALIGIRYILNMKCEQLMQGYESVLRDNEINYAPKWHL